MAFTVGPPSATRIERIRVGILEAEYSIHDLSRNLGEGPHNLARMNMPLELGMAMMRAHVAEVDPRFGEHEWLALIPRGFDEDAFVSNLRAYDLQAYDPTNIPDLLAAVAGFLTGRSQVELEPDALVATYEDFHAAASAARRRWGPMPAWWSAVVRLAVNHAKRLAG